MIYPPSDLKVPDKSNKIHSEILPPGFKQFQKFPAQVIRENRLYRIEWAKRNVRIDVQGTFC